MKLKTRSVVIGIVIFFLLGLQQVAAQGNLYNNMSEHYGKIAFAVASKVDISDAYGSSLQGSYIPNDLYVYGCKEELELIAKSYEWGITPIIGEIANDPMGFGSNAYLYAKNATFPTDNNWQQEVQHSPDPTLGNLTYAYWKYAHPIDCGVDWTGLPERDPDEGNLTEDDYKAIENFLQAERQRKEWAQRQEEVIVRQLEPASSSEAWEIPENLSTIMAIALVLLLFAYLGLRGRFN